MKMAPIVPQATEPTELGKAASPDIETGNKTRESLSLSPERIEDGVSTKTAVMQEILDRAEKASGWRHWGINE